MFGVLRNELKNIGPLYRKEDLLNQLAFAVFSTSESFVFKQSNATLVLIDRPNLVNNNTEFSAVINRTRSIDVSDSSFNSNGYDTVQNKTDSTELNLLGLISINLPSVLLE